MRRSTRAGRKREHDGTTNETIAGDKRVCASPPEPAAKATKAAAAAKNSVKKSKHTAIATRGSPSSSCSSGEDDVGADASGDASTASAGLEWGLSLFSTEQRAQWGDFLRTKCLARVGDDFFDLFELAHTISKDRPLDAFVDTLGIRLCGLFDLLDTAVQARCGDKKVDVSYDKPLFLHGRCFFDPPEVTTILSDTTSDNNGAHWGYFRDSPEQTPEYVVFAEDSSKCAFNVAGSSLFHVLDARIKEQSAKNTANPGLKALSTQVDAHLRSRKPPSRVTPSTLGRKRASKVTAPSLHQLGIVVPYDAKKQTGFRELPVVGEQLTVLLQQVQDGNATARKTLSGLITRATIANDECDFGTSLLLGLDLFTAGPALEARYLSIVDWNDWEMRG